MGRPAALAIALAAAVTLAACGQKSGVHLASRNNAAAGSEGVAGVSAGDQGASAGGQGAGGQAAGGATGAAAGGAGATGGAAGAAGAAAARPGAGAAGGASAAGAAAGPSGPGDSTGVAGDSIAIGIHAPATGAGAPAPSFDQGKDKYFNFIGPAINGRAVKVFFEDDGYNPSQAVAACKKLVQVDHVFLLVGGGGTDQIVACAQYAASVGVPYLAEGVTEAGVNNLKSYFAESMSYKTQGTLLAQYIKRQGFSQVMMVRGNTQNFEDAHSGFVTAAKGVGLTLARDDAVPKDADAQTMSSEAAQICGSLDARSGKVAVYPLMSPKLFINLAGAAASQQCFPRYAGIGITLGLNVVAQALCPTGAFKNGATFFSPFQGLDAVDQVDPDFHKAYSNGDDIGFALWGAEKLLTAQLKAAGKDLTRQGFVAAIQGKSFNTGVYPVADFTQGHFGGTAVHVLKADCGRNQYVTEAQNARSF
jgi:ABC-type branched-subunit amino acid transport system substrate-binding protein